MASGDEDLYPRNNQSRNKTTTSKLQMLLVVLFTNFITIYVLTSPSLGLKNPPSSNPDKLSLPQWPACSSDSLSKGLNSTIEELFSSQSLIAELNEKLNSTTALVETLLIELARKIEDRLPPSSPSSLWESLVNHQLGQSGDEIKRAVGPHKLPFGKTPTSGTDEILSSFGAGCLRVPPEELAEYMSYEVGGECPKDDILAQTLMLKGCEPLPRRRCHPSSPEGYVEPTQLPQSLWATPPDSSVSWHPYTCKNYACLINRMNTPGSYDCKDCFDLMGREKSRWLFDNGGLDYGIDNVLGLKPHGTIRIGLDIGGGSGTFAARMRERNVTILTSSMNFDGPFNSFIASRGLIPIHLTIAHRFPFFENTLDLVHSMHVLSNWIPDRVLEFILYDVYRVLRPGGIFWLDHFFCVGPQLNHTYIPVINRIGFKKLRWNVGLKLDRGAELNEVYLSALLEKPMT